METRQRASARPQPAAGRAAHNIAGDGDAPTDRQLQDHIIRYLTDAAVRSDQQVSGLLEGTEAARAQRFSRFLARRYYRDRLYRGFRYTRLLAPSHAPERLIDGPQLDSILDTCILGSLATSKTIGRTVVAGLSSARGEAWWAELVEYEVAFFQQLATSEGTPEAPGVHTRIATVIHKFAHRIPQLLMELGRRREPPPNLLGQTTLLFSRTPHGRVYVVELDLKTEALLNAISSGNDFEQLQQSGDLAREQLERALSALRSVGAIT